MLYKSGLHLSSNGSSSDAQYSLFFINWAWHFVFVSEIRPWIQRTSVRSSVCICVDNWCLGSGIWVRVRNRDGYKYAYFRCCENETRWLAALLSSNFALKTTEIFKYSSIKFTSCWLFGKRMQLLQLNSSVNMSFPIDNDATIAILLRSWGCRICTLKMRSIREID